MGEWSYSSHSLSVSIEGPTALRKSTLRDIVPLLCVINEYPAQSIMLQQTGFEMA
jgi:hypothetical protein